MHSLIYLSFDEENILQKRKLILTFKAELGS
jgi:hypothetical protein